MQRPLAWALAAWVFAAGNVSAQSSDRSSNRASIRSTPTSSTTSPSTTSTLCLTTSVVQRQALNGTAYNATTVITGTCANIPATTVSQSTDTVYTLAPWLSAASQTIVSHVETFVISQSTVSRTLYFAVPAQTNVNAAATIDCPAPTTVTVSVVSCPTTAANAQSIVPGSVPNTVAGQADSGQVGSGQQSIANGNGAPIVVAGSPNQAAATTTLTKAITTFYLSTITSYSTYTVASTQTQYFTVTGLAGTVTTSKASVVTSVVTSTILLPSTVPVTTTATLTQTIVNGNTQTGVLQPTAETTTPTVPNGAQTSLATIEPGFSNSDPVPLTLTTPRYLNNTYTYVTSTYIPVEAQSTMTTSTPAELQTATSGLGIPIIVPGIPGQFTETASSTASLAPSSATVSIEPSVTFSIRSTGLPASISTESSAGGFVFTPTLTGSGTSSTSSPTELVSSTSSVEGLTMSSTTSAVSLPTKSISSVSSVVGPIIVLSSASSAAPSGSSTQMIVLSEPSSSSTATVTSMTLSGSSSSATYSSSTTPIITISGFSSSSSTSTSTSSSSATSGSSLILSRSSSSSSSSSRSSTSLPLRMSSSSSSTSSASLSSSSSPTMTLSPTNPSSSTRTFLPLSSSSSSSSSVSCPIGTLAPSATAPAPPQGTNVYNIAGDVQHLVEESKLLAAISFPKGFNCNKKLVILQPGTAVPAIDTFSNTFIPAFENEATIAEAGEVDIMMLTIPTVSLGPAWQTAEYIAYAMNYANLVLKRPGTIIAWSQGNLNVQWAFKYWPSTRTDVEGRNYVAISADYDGTILGSFLCQPISILTSGSGATLIEQFIENNGLNVILAALGLSALPMSGTTGMSDPEAFKAILLNFVYGPAATQGLGGGIVGDSSSVSSVPFSTTTAEVAMVTKRAVPFGRKEDVVKLLRAQADKAQAEKRQATLLSPLVTLVGGIADPVLEELATIIVNPAAPLTQIFANLAKLVTDPSNLSLVPSGCAPAVWDQGYGSTFINKLAENGGNLAYVPTTSIFSLTDEVVQPQGITGVTAASAYMPSANPGAPAPENIYIQEHCTLIGNLLLGDIPPLITHEGVLASGMGVSAAILAVISGSTVSYEEIVARYGQSEACAILSDRLTVDDFLGNEASIVGALARITVNPGVADPDAQFVSEEIPLPSYTNNA